MFEISTDIFEISTYFFEDFHLNGWLHILFYDFIYKNEDCM